MLSDRMQVFAGAIVVEDHISPFLSRRYVQSAQAQPSRRGTRRPGRVAHCGRLAKRALPLQSRGRMLKAPSAGKQTFKTVSSWSATVGTMGGSGRRKRSSRPREPTTRIVTSKGTSDPAGLRRLGRSRGRRVSAVAVQPYQYISEPETPSRDRRHLGNDACPKARCRVTDKR